MKTKLLKKLLPLVLVFAVSSCTKNSTDEVASIDRTLFTNYDYSNEETQLAQMINDYRVSHGKETLIRVDHISCKSKEHNDYMIFNNKISHDNFTERAQNLIDVLGAYEVGENLAYNFSFPSTVLNAWLNSPGHKANLDGDYTHFGISISTCPSTGKKYYTNMFMKK